MSIGDDSGAIAEGDRMTEAREWPNNAKEARDQAAERICRALKLLNDAFETGSHNNLLRLQKELYEALRWLESAGAPTRPEGL